jgi:hypothetical protein
MLNECFWKVGVMADHQLYSLGCKTNIKQSNCEGWGLDGSTKMQNDETNNIYLQVLQNAFKF